MIKKKILDRIWFRYGEDWTLQDVSFTVLAGRTTALVGETGSGNTSLGYLAAWLYFFFFQAEDGIRDFHVTGVQTCALPISSGWWRSARPGSTTSATTRP